MYQSLKFRFGVILALALTPLLVFSAWSSYYDYTQDLKLRKAVIQDAGILAVGEIIDTLDTSKSLLLTTAQTITDENCETNLKILTESYMSVNNMALSAPDGQVLCSALPIVTNEPGFEASKKISEDSPFYINTYDFTPKIESMNKEVVIMSFGHYEDGVLKKIMISNTNVSKITDINKRDILPNDVEVSVFSSSGNVIIGPKDFETSKKDIWIETIKNTGLYRGEITSKDNFLKTITVLPTREPEIFVALTAPKQSLLDWNRVDPFASSIVPFLAWIFGFGATWIATDKLLLRHLRRMERTTHSISNGAYEERLGDYNNAPQQIQDLAASFDGMLETLKARDKKITDSLDEKESLLREIHHRVKNNLQIIISLLNMQKRRSKNEEFLIAIEKTRNRVSTIALVHKALYESDDIRRVDMTLFLDQLVRQLSKTLSINKNKIQITTAIECAGREADQATPIGLFIVEAMTNIVEHKSLKDGVISVRVSEDNQTTTVQVCDMGKILDLPTVGSKDSFALMKGFARQLSGKFSIIETPNERIAELSFPLGS